MNNLVIPGFRSGKLVAVERVCNLKNNTWKCICDCGTERLAQAADLVRNIYPTISCGCFFRGEDHSGKIYGTLKVIKRGANKGKQVYWLCECRCGTTREFAANRLKRIKSCGCEHPRKRKAVNDKYWSALSLENCYYAGFIAADGYIRKNTLSVTIKSTDFKYLQKLCDNIKWEGVIKIRKNGPGGKYESASFKLTSPTIINDLLKKFNIANKKSLTLKPPNYKDWPQEFKHAFICGIIDGDGCIYLDKRRNKITNQINIVGTQEILSWIREEFEKLTDFKKSNKIRKAKPKSKAYQFSVCGKKAEFILKKLLVYNIPRLNRKWDKVVTKDG